MRNKLTVFLFYGKHDLYTIGDEILTILAQIDHFLCYICIFIQKQLHKHYSDAFQQIIFTKIFFTQYRDIYLLKYTQQLL